MRMFCRCLLALSVVSPSMAQTFNITTSSTEKELAMLQAVGEEAFDRLGHALLVSPMPAERSLLMADSGQSDGDGLRVMGLEARYPHLLAVPESIMDTEFSAVVRNPAIQRIDGWEGLKPYRVGLIRGWKIVEQNTRGAKSVYAAADYHSLFRMLAHDRIDVAIYTRPDVRGILETMQLAQLRLLEPPLDTRPMVLYLHRSHEALVPELDRVLKAMKRDGRWQAIQARVLGPDAAQ